MTEISKQNSERSVTEDRKPPHSGSSGELTVEVYSPRSPESKKFTWPKKFLVGDAADEAAKKFEYEAGTPTFQNSDKTVLDRKQTLLDAGVRDFDALELVDTGGGV